MRKYWSVLGLWVFHATSFATSDSTRLYNERLVGFRTAHQASSSVVHISNKFTNVAGSGFFIDQNTLVTNLHVLEGILKSIADNLNLRQDISSKHHQLKKAYFEKKASLLDFISIALPDKNSPLPVFDSKIKITKIKHLSAINDLAILEVRGYKGPYLKLGRSPSPGGASDYFLIGYPGTDHNDKVLREKNTKIIGTVLDVVDSQFLFISYDDFYHKGLRGTSGGPLMNLKGEVVGIFTYGILSLVSGETVESLKSLLTKSKVWAVSSAVFDEVNFRIY